MTSRRSTPITDMARRSKNDSGAIGCLIVDKPAGCTSHDVVDIARKALKTRRVGHAGTLDPDATGVLVLGVGLGTKLLQFVTGASKTYTGEIAFGTETSTLDAAGEVIETHDMSFIAAEVEAAAAMLTGDILQVPPMVSALRVGGKRLHELAREGIEVEREPRPVTVARFATSPTDDPLVYQFDVEVSSGTYVRTLAADLGHALGGGAHLRSLRRTSVGPFVIDEACSLDDLILRPVTDLVRGMPLIEVDESVAQQVMNGRSLGPSGGTGRLAVAGPDGTLLAVYEVQGGQLKPAKVLVGN